MRRVWDNRLHNQAGDGTGGTQGGGGAGASGTGSLLTSDNGGGGNSSSQGASNSGTNPAGNQPQANSGTGGNSQGNQNQDWRSQLPPELQENVSIKKFTDLSALAGAYVNLQKLIGGDKIPVPSEHATDEDWGNVFKKLGLPEKVDDYKVEFDKEAGIQEDFAKQFREQAHKFGVLPKQAQKLAKWFSEVNVQAEQSIKTQKMQALEKEHGNLKAEWGQAYDNNLAKAKAVLREHGDPDLINYLNQSGLGNDVQLIKLFSKLGTSMYKEGKIIDPGQNPGALAPADAKAQYQKIMGDQNHPYWKAEHPGHKTAVEEVQKLMKLSLG